MRPIKKRTVIWISIAAIVIIAFTAGAIVRGKDKNLQTVTTAKVTRADLVSKVTANGKIEAKRKVDLSANVMGQIVNLAVREGDVVKKGDFLMQIDKAQLAASAVGAEESVKALLHDRDAARASADEAKQSFARAQRSYDEHLISPADLDKARAAVNSAEATVAAVERRIDQARAALTGARDTLSKTTMRAPMDGIVTRLPVEEGEVAVIGTMNNPGTVLMTISDMSVVEAVMEVDETDIPAVKLGQKANVTVDAYPSRTFTGTVTEVGSSPISGTGLTTNTEAINFEVKIQLDAPPAGIRPGFSVSAEITTGTRPQATAVPIQALVVRDKPSKGAGQPATEEGVYLFDAKQQKVRFAPVKTGITGETSVEVVSGVRPGEEIVTGPFRALREIKDGDRVKLEKAKGGDKGEKKS